MRGHRGLHLNGLTLVALVVTTLFASPAQAGDLTFSMDLRTGVADSPIPPWLAFETPLQDTNGDGWYNTVLRINLNDPSIGNPYYQANFRVEYTAAPTGLTVNIGDSRTNNGFGGDAATQSNDAEINIGDVPGGTRVRDLFVFGKDGTPTPGNLLAQVPNFAGNGVVADLSVRNEFFAWNNNQGLSGSLTSPYLFALNGQPDTEGPVNYNIYAAFNQSIDGDYRPGTGVGRVTVTLLPVPEPTSLILLGLGLVGIGISIRQRRGVLRR